MNNDDVHAFSISLDQPVLQKRYQWPGFIWNTRDFDPSACGIFLYSTTAKIEQYFAELDRIFPLN